MAVRTEGRVRLQRRLRGQKERSVWCGERKGDTETRPSVGSAAGRVLGRAGLEVEQGQMARSEQVSVGVRK